MNRYAAVPNDIKGRLQEAATKALENDIREAMRILSSGRGNEFEAVIKILGSLVGDE